MQKYLAKMRNRWAWGMVVLFGLLGLGVRVIWPASGVGFTADMAGLLAFVSMGILALFGAALVDLVDQKFGINTTELLRKLWPTVFVSLLATNLITPLSDWLKALLGL